MANKKVIFVAFAMEDVRMRDLLKGQSLNTNSPLQPVGACAGNLEEVGLAVTVGRWLNCYKRRE